jgi:hypothetical protein
MQLLTNYVGHGDVTHWTGDGLFESSDVASLNNGQNLSFVVSLDCLNGYFSQPYNYCLGEEFVAAPDKGAIASFVPSSLGYTWEHALLAGELFDAIFTDHVNVLGVLSTQSKIKAYADGATPDIVKSFVLLGDPVTRLKTGQ